MSTTAPSVAVVSPSAGSSPSSKAKKGGTPSSGSGGPSPSKGRGKKAKLLQNSNSQQSAPSQSQSQPMDLAPRGPSVVQLRPVRQVSFSSKGTPVNTINVNNNGTTSSGAGTVNVNVNATPIISVNRSAPTNLTLLPRGTSPGVSVGVTAAGTATATLNLGVGTIQGIPGNTQIPTYQITRLGSVRPATPGSVGVGVGVQQPASITVTPLPTANLGANIRLAPAGTTVNNGAWLGTTGGTTFSPIRAATITVGGRPVRPAEGKMITIPQQHVTQLQMVDGKGSILKPGMTTPIVNIRGTLPGGATSGSQVTLPISPFTIRTANITNISAIQRPPNSTTVVTPVHKVITQPSAGTPIQFVNANKNVLQAITPLPKLSTVCLTLSTNATLAPSNSTPVVAVASRQGGPPSLIMTPSSIVSSSGTSVTTATLPITKVFPVGVGLSREQVIDFSNSNPNSGSGAVSVSAVTIATTSTLTPASTTVSTTPHLIVHTPTINVHANPPISNSSSGSSTSLPPPNLAAGSIAPGVGGYFALSSAPSDTKGFQMRPISLEKKTIDAKSLPPGSMIITTNTIPLNSQHLNITHLQQGGSTNTQQSSVGGPLLSLGPGPPAQITVTPASQPSGTSSGAPLQVPLPSVSVISGISSSILTVTTTSVNTNATSSSSTSSSGSHSGSSSLTNTSTSATVPPPHNNNGNNSGGSSSTVSIPAQSPNQNHTQNSSTTSTTTSTTSTSSKATHSPRPSILRKRELVDYHHSLHSSRAQRNLNLQLNLSSNTSNKENSISLKDVNVEKFGSGLTITPTSSSGGGSSSVSILKKEFQPPTEESSWQSVSSNSSSGSSTISTTSETAELQMQQQLRDAGGSLDLSLHSHSQSEPVSAFVGVGLNSIGKSTSTISSVGGQGLGLGLGLSSSSTPLTMNVNQHNGVLPLRTTQPRSRSSSTSKNRDIERLKKGKEDAVSPRKKPRKQQLTSSDLLEAASPEIYYQGKGKRFRKGDLMDFTDGGDKDKGSLGVSSTSDLAIPDDLPPEKDRNLGTVYAIKRRHVALLNWNSIPPKPLTTHFQRYCDVRAKEEKRPTVTDLANQKNILTTVSGWRVKHMAAQMNELVEGETNVVDKCTSLLSRLETKAGPNCSNRDLNTVMELLKGNIQRCKVIRDQMFESRHQALKILDHQPFVLEAINKYSFKRPQKRKIL